ncbi:MAG TPA: lytic transglycosylase domain-containing protein [Chloroflexota bacterium]|nr:lytic transglycosylase domain-containing protein [Chloroflexota bacterium]
MTAGAYAIDLRPRTARRTAPAPLALLALATLGLGRCRDALPGLVVAGALVALVVRPLPGLLALPPALTAAIHAPALPSFAVPGSLASLRASQPDPGVLPASGASVSPASPATLTSVAAAGAVSPESGVLAALRAPWTAPALATAPFPAHIEAWRPLVRELLGEAWQEGRLDGPAARIDDDLVLALIRQESQGDPNAESWVGAIGLMQVMPFTFADVMAGDRALTCAIDLAAMWDVRSNMRAGLRYLALAMNAHEGNVYWALAAYNAGIDAVSDWRAAGLYAVPPAGGYWETADYAQRILRDYLSRRPDVAPLIHVPDAMPQAHVPGALRLLQELDTQRGGPRPKEWIPRCGR